MNTERGHTVCAINWQVLLEYVKVLLSWPPIALAITLLFISKFRPSIDDFIKRLVEGNIFGQNFKAVPSPQQSSTSGAEENLLTKASEAVPQTTDSQEQNLPPSLANDPTAHAAVNYVREHPVDTILEYRSLLFKYNSERLYTSIYGTQIALLEFLASRPNAPASLAELVQFHDEHQKKVGSNTYQLREYVNFLVNYEVVTVSGAEDSLEYTITQGGVEFLSYIKANYPTNWNQRAL